VHGLGRSARDFDGLRAALGREWRWITPELPYHGAAAADTGGDTPATLATFSAAVIQAVQEALEAQPPSAVVLIGHSLGAAVCVEVAGALGDRVAHIIALDALLNPRVYPRQPAALVRLSQAASRLLHPLMARLLARVLLPAPRNPALYADVVQGLLALPARVAAEASADLAAWDRDAALQQCAAPITLIPATPFYRPALYTPLAARCELAGPVDGSHFFLRERPEDTAALLRPMLEPVAAG
jgi:pimeloyl-ACP methyl ester carboxylesterase